MVLNMLQSESWPPDDNYSFLGLLLINTVLNLGLGQAFYLSSVTKGDEVKLLIFFAILFLIPQTNYFLSINFKFKPNHRKILFNLEVLQ